MILASQLLSLILLQSPFIEELKSDFYQIRENAEQKLIVPSYKSILLKELGQTDDLEVKLRIKGILSKIAEKEIWSPSLIELDGKTRPLYEYLDIISKQCGLPIDSNEYYSSDNDLCKAQSGNLLEVLDNLGKQSRGIFRDKDFYATGDDYSYDMFKYCGPFRCQLDIVERKYLQEIKDNKIKTSDINDVIVNFSLQCEPRLSVTKIGPIKIIADNYRSENTQQSFGYYGQKWFKLNSKFSMLPINLTLVKDLEIKIPISIVGGTKQIEVDISKPQEIRFEDHDIEILHDNDSTEINIYPLLLLSDEFNNAVGYEILFDKTPHQLSYSENRISTSTQIKRNSVDKVIVSVPTIRSSGELSFKYSDIIVPGIK